MASKTTLNAKNLEALGAARLADLLLEITAGDAALKRRLRLALAASSDPDDLARAIRKRLTTLGQSTSFIETSSAFRALATDLRAQHKAIVQDLAPAKPTEALSLLWHFLDLARPVFNRCDDSNGVLGDVFEKATEDLIALANAVKPDPMDLANAVFDIVVHADYGHCTDLITGLAPALGPSGLDHLRQRAEDLAAQPVPDVPKEERLVVAWGPTGPFYQDEFERRRRQGISMRILTDIADAKGDVDAFMGQFSPEQLTFPRVATEVAQRLLAAGRAEEALRLLEGARGQEKRGFLPPDFEWLDARIAALTALNRIDEAQQLRWACFEETLGPDFLREYLQALPDFEDVEAEAKALDYAQTFKEPLMALAFLIHWGALDRAAALVLSQAEQWDGQDYQVLAPATDQLEENYPLAATVLARAAITFALIKKRSARYKHAAKDLSRCAVLAQRIPDFGPLEPHDAFMEALRRDHAGKAAFWKHVQN